MAPGRTLMVQGTSSAVGKSLLVTGLCRYYRDLGLRVAPFKAQNMALNSAVTPEGLEIGRAQAVQAEAAGIPPHVDMNPILLKPEAGGGCQVVVMGEPATTIPSSDYHPRALSPVVEASLLRLRQQYDLVILEGAGSPAEINLKSRDIANMYLAELADAPVLLVGDIDRGGVFAALAGTLLLLEPHERKRVVGLVINKFRGDLGLLRDGLSMIEARVERPVLGVLPFLPELRIAEEDSVALEQRRAVAPHPDRLDVAVLRFPHLSNLDDVLALEHEPDVGVRFVERLDALGAPDAPDLVILPGSKSTRADLVWLRERGFEPWLRKRAERAAPILGICGGYQMLGERIVDAESVEGGGGEAEGLGLLPCVTRFAPHKVTRRVHATPLRSLLTGGAETPLAAVAGYEIHMGDVVRAGGAAPLWRIDDRTEGCQDPGGAVAGTLIHGVLEDDALRHAMLRGLAARRGLSALRFSASRPDAEYDRVAAAVAEHLDTEQLARLAGI